MKKIDINDAEHPYRQTAINILEKIQDRAERTSAIRNELWFELEDFITYSIAKVKES